jgi:putative transposase
MTKKETAIDINENDYLENSENKKLLRLKKIESNVILFPNDEITSDLEVTQIISLTADNHLIDSSQTNSGNVSQQKRLDELSDKHLEKYSENYRLVLKVQSGLTVPQACRAINWSKSVRTAYDTYHRFKRLGKEGLKDHRWERKPEAKVLTDEVKDIIMAWRFQRRAAAPRAVWKLTCETCRERSLTEPAETTVKNFLYNLPVGVKLALKGARGLKQWQKQHASVIVQNKTSFSNELWQGDHTELPIWTRRKINGEWVEAKVYASALLDDYSRVNPGLLISHKYYDGWSISILYRQAILKENVPGLQVCGLPCYTESDRGADWISEAVQTMVKSLGIQPIIDPAYFPNAKGKIERFFRFLDTSLLTTLPGHKKDVGTTPQAAKKRVMEFLTLEQLRDEITKWRVWYHNRVHSETDRKPIELWEETVHFRYPESEDDLNILLLKYDRERTILNCGIKLVIDKTKHLYWLPAFDLHTGRRVRIGYNPEDMESVYVYCANTGEFLFEAWDTRAEHPRYSLADVKASRLEEKRRLQGLQSRLSKYFEDVSSKDRLIEQRKEWDEARLLTTKLPETTEEENLEEKELADAMEMLRQLNRQQD